MPPINKRSESTRHRIGESADESASDRPAAARFLTAVVTLNVLAVATFDLLPTFVEGTRETLHFSESEVGVFSAIFFTGNVVGSLLAKYWVRRVNWRRAARLALAGLIAFNVAGAFVSARDAFLAMQFLVGISAASLYSLALTILSDRDDPERHFGLLIAAQVAFQAVGLYAGPFILAHGGLRTLLLLLAALSALGLGMVDPLPSSGRAAVPSISFARLLRPATAVAYLGCFAFFLSAGSYWTFIELIGHDSNFTEKAIAQSLVAGVGAGLVGALMASWAGARWPKLWMLAIGTAMIVGAAALLSGRIGIEAFVLSNCLFNFSWNFSIVYQYSIVNSADPTAHAVALTPAFHTAGAAAGPAIAAALIRPHDYSSVEWLGVTGVIASLACFAMAVRLGARRATR